MPRACVRDLDERDGASAEGDRFLAHVPALSCAEIGAGQQQASPPRRQSADINPGESLQGAPLLAWQE
jgi:hypothetical protein